MAPGTGPARPDGARGLHDHPARGGVPGLHHSRISRSELFPARAGRRASRAARHQTAPCTQDARHAGRSRQHDEGHDSRQERGDTKAGGTLFSPAGDMNAGAVVGLLVMIVSESATLARIEPFYHWNTPIAW